MTTLIHLFLTTLLALAASLGNASTLTIDQERAQLNEINLAQYAAYVLDEKALAIDQILVNADWIQNNEPMLNFVYNEGAAYIKLAIENSTDEPIERVISVDFPLIDHVAFFIETDLQFITGDMQPFANRQLKTFYFGLPFSLAPFETKTFYIRTHTQAGLQVPLKLYTIEAFFGEEAKLIGIISAVFVLAIAVCLMTGILGYSSDNEQFKSLFWMSIYICSFLFCYYTVPHRLLVTEDSTIVHFVMISSIALCIICIGRFHEVLYRKRLKFIRKSTTLAKLNQILTAGGVSIILSYLIWGFEVATLITYSIAITTFYGCAYLVYPYRDKIKYGRFYMGVWAVCGLSASIGGLADTGFIIGEYYWHANGIVFLFIATSLLGLVYLSGMTQRRERDESLEKLKRLTSEDMIRDKNIMLGQLVGGLNHEIKTPLASIRLTLEALRDQFGSGDSDNSKEVRQVIDSSLSSGDKIATIMSDMRAIAKVDSEFEQVDSFALIDVIELIRHLDSRIIVDSKHLNKHLQISGSKAMISQLFINLYNNSKYALEATTKPTIIDSARERAKHVEITWRDNGCGISDEDINKIFDPFFTTKPKNEGTGLGLANCLSIVGVHKGSISVSSELGEYTEFSISIPTQIEATLT